jgi:Icc-related predicted phosphoesterase
MKLGIIADNHSGGHEKRIVKELKKLKVDLLINLGDLNNPYISTDIYEFQKRFLKIEKPFISIPGNDEYIGDWNYASRLLSGNKNFIDGTKQPIFCYNGLYFISVGGSENNINEYGFRERLNSDGRGAINLEKILNEAIQKKVDFSRAILLTHEPPKQNGNSATDLAVHAEHLTSKEIIFGEYIKFALSSGEYRKKLSNEGSHLLTDFIKKTGIKFVFSGHIHEAFGAVNENGESVKEHEYTPALFLNPGPAKNGMFATVDVNEKNMEMKYKLYLLLGKSGFEKLKE